MGFVPQMSRNEVQVELPKAQHARYARAFLLGIFLSVENKGCLNYIPKLVIRVRSSSPAPTSREKHRLWCKLNLVPPNVILSFGTPCCGACLCFLETGRLARM